MPFADNAAHLITVENAPLRAGIGNEIARVIRPGGKVILRHPSDYAAAQHGKIIAAVRGRSTQRVIGGMTETTIYAR
jgi:hypothetical protein